jgi:hypothetical protein
LVAETWSARELLNAGWIEADLAWEAAVERAANAVAEGNYTLAKDEAGKALQLARADFDPVDPRLGTSLANYGLCLSLSGHSGSVAPLFREALDVWRRADPWIARMDAPRVARSSLFHMRMEALHRDTYRARWQERWQEMAAEAKVRIAALHAPHGALGATGAESLARWRRERPAMLNDTRKLMAASFLLLAPPAPKADSA